MRITGGRILTSEGFIETDLVVAGETIVGFADPADAAGDEPVVDATDRWVLPGGVDAHTHFGMPLGGGVRSQGWRDASEAALLGGTTTVIDFANPEPGESLAAAAARWRQPAAGRCLCDHGLHVTIADTSAARLAEIPELVAAGLPTCKGFLAYKGRLMLSPDQMRDLMVAVARAGGRLLIHAEDGELNAAAERLLLDTGRTAPRYHAVAHPPESEVRAVDQALELALATGCPTTLVHLSLGASLDLLTAARRRRDRDRPDLPLVGEVCLHHVFATDELYHGGHEAALAAICSPPLRPAADGAVLLAGLADGALDLLSTDHCAFPLRLKADRAASGFPAVPNGCGGVGERLTVSHALAVATGRLTPARWHDVVARRPAELMGLAGRKGRLAAGHDADIVLFDPRPTYRWQPLGRSDRAGSLWSGLPVTGKVTDVWLRGRQVVEGGRLAADVEAGVFLTRRFPS